MSKVAATPPLTVEDVLAELKALGDEKRRAHNAKFGAGDNQFGVKLGDIRALAKKIKTNDELGLALWNTGNTDARLLAILLIKPKSLSVTNLDHMVRSVSSLHVADWINAYLVKKHPENEMLRQGWMTDSDPMAARAGWNLTSIRVAKKPEGLDLPALLDRLEAEMGNAAPEAQWTMNYTLGKAEPASTLSSLMLPV
ncbi:MAG: DNA alkylation repair protein [Chloroflexota bacterium]